MAEADDGQLRTEDPTPRRREEARQRGQVAVSPELTAAAVLLAGAVSLQLLGPAAGARLLDAVRADLADVRHADLAVADAQRLAAGVYVRVVAVGGAFFGLAVAAAVAAGAAQVGVRVLPERLAVDLDRLSPAHGLGRLVSAQGLAKAALALAKVAVLAAVAAVVVKSHAGAIPQLGRAGPAEAVAAGWAVCIRVILWLAGALAVLGLADYLVQWRRVEASLRMTRQELKDEAKREDGDPAVRQRLRQRQRQLAQRRLLAAVPTATAVVTNPTHLAVALRYDRHAGRAPVVVAKGAGVFARQIAQLARRHAVPVLERPPLARALYAVADGGEVPPHLFRAVAEVIAFVFRLRGVT